MHLPSKSFINLLALLIFILSLLFVIIPASKVSAVPVVPPDGLRIHVTGPNEEPATALPSVQADRNIWYNIIVTGLEPTIAGYHLKIYKRVGDDGTPYAPGYTNRELKANWHAEGVDSNCAYIYGWRGDGTPDIHGGERDALSDSRGRIFSRLPDHKLPDSPPIGDFVFEVARSDSSGGDCVRSSHDPRKGYVAHVNITIVETPRDYNPNPPEFPDPRDLTDLLPENVRAVTSFLMSFGLGIAGGVAFLMLIYGGFRFVFSAGNPEAVQQGREILTAAIIGLLVVVFSVFLLRLIGISILGLPI